MKAFLLVLIEQSPSKGRVRQDKSCVLYDVTQNKNNELVRQMSLLRQQEYMDSKSLYPKNSWQNIFSLHVITLSLDDCMFHVKLAKK